MAAKLLPGLVGGPVSCSPALLSPSSGGAQFELFIAYSELFLKVLRRAVDNCYP
jgi:hypothetical protein